MSDQVEWHLDNGSTVHITPVKSDFVQYREFGHPEITETTDGKFLIIEGFGTIIRHSIMLEGMVSLQIQKSAICPKGK